MMYGVLFLENNGTNLNKRALWLSKKPNLYNSVYINYLSMLLLSVEVFGELETVVETPCHVQHRHSRFSLSLAYT